MSSRIVLSILLVITSINGIFQLSIDPFTTKIIPGLYTEQDHIEVLTKHNFHTVYGSNRAAFVEFYSHWCGACQRYSKHWKELGELTKRWHSSVIRVSAINCADPMNADVCKAFDITAYPTLKLIPPYANYDKNNHDATYVKTKENSLLIEDMFNFIENHNGKIPINWPNLSSFTSTELKDLFVDNKYALLVAENLESDLGRKLILDYSNIKDQLPIRRISKEKNQILYEKLNVQNSLSVYLIKSDHSHALFDRDAVKKFESQSGYSNSKIGSNVDLENLSDRRKYQYLIDDFTNFLNIGGTRKDYNFSKKKSRQLVPNSNNDINKNDQQADSYLTSTNNRIFMQDLESGLSYMLRSEIGMVKYISGEKLIALKDILRILVKFFPGRKPVRNYLSNLYESAKNKDFITRNQWLDMVKKQGDDMYLPSKIEWRHCNGSSDIYRGYPCSLWTLFHVLTVSQVEQEKTKQNSFGNDYDVKEVIKAIRIYIFNFFGCTECAEHFKKETENWKSQLIDHYDAVRYLWSIHNKVNERLRIEGNNDPKYPKIIFPSKAQCPECYNTEERGNQYGFNEKEIIKYLISFYSTFQIEGVMELDIKKSLNDNQQFNGGDDMIDPSRKLLEGVEFDKVSKNMKQFNENTSSKLINFSIFLILITVMGLFFMLYGFNKNRERVKAHII